MYILRFIHNPVEVFLFLISVVVAVTFHEFAHAWAADRLGDPTARLLGRKSLHPAKHLDPWGSLLFLVVGFGWGKPVPVDSFNLRDAQKDNALIALAGPVSNLFLAGIAGIIHFFIPHSLDLFLFTFAVVNVSLAVFNLLPIPPLDGSRLYRAVFPQVLLPLWEFLDQFGLYILLFLIVFDSNFFSQLLQPILFQILRLLGFYS